MDKGGITLRCRGEPSEAGVEGKEEPWNGCKGRGTLVEEFTNKRFIRQDGKSRRVLQSGILT
jgi:hypothetical protein